MSQRRLTGTLTYQPDDEQVILDLRANQANDPWGVLTLVYSTDDPSGARLLDALMPDWKADRP